MRAAFCAVIISMGALAGLAGEPQRKEQDKIDALLKCVEESQGLIFVRNGDEFDGKTAAAHMRNKLAKAGDTIQTVEQFIDQIASKSKQSSEPYQIKLAGGATKSAGEWLRAELKKIEDK